MLVALIAGAIAAHADSGGARAPRADAGARRAAPARRGRSSAPAPLAIACAAPVPVDPVPTQTPQPRTPKAATAAPPSQALLDAFAILRRPRTDQDALSPEALEALRVRGLSPVSLDSSRLLRSTPSGGKAWVVPVPERRRPTRRVCGPVGKSAPREGLVVVAVGDAASGGGGALDDLVRGRAPVTVAPCAGADHSMLSISGIVPNGVPAVFLTAPDGTAVRADVKDNAYEFLLPNQRTLRAALRRVDRGRRDAPRPADRHLRRRAGRARARPPPSCRSPWRACRPTGSSRAGRRPSAASPRFRVPRRASRARAPAPTGAHALRRALHGARPFAPSVSSPAPGPGAAGRRACRLAPVAGGARPPPSAGSPAPGARRRPQAPLTARRPRVASMRWLLPEPSSS